MMIIILLVSIKNHDISSTSKLDVNELQKKNTSDSICLDLPQLMESL